MVVIVCCMCGIIRISFLCFAYTYIIYLFYVIVKSKRSGFHPARKHVSFRYKFIYNIKRAPAKKLPAPCNTSLRYKTIISVPAPIKMHPINDLVVNVSCKNTNANISVITTLNLSIGTILDASPICNAL